MIFDLFGCATIQALGEARLENEYNRFKGENISAEKEKDDGLIKDIFP